MPRRSLLGLDVVSFLRKYKITMGFEASGTQRAPIVFARPGPVPDSLEFPSNLPFNMTVIQGSSVVGSDGKKYRSQDAHKSSDVFIQLTWGALGRETGIRYLPWAPNKNVYVRLDQKSDFAITGPLQGCNVYVAGPKNAPLFMHTNWNKDDGPAGTAAKQKLALDVLAGGGGGVPNNTLIGGRLERETYSMRGIGGFVVGVRENTDWAFYFCGQAPVDGFTTVRRIF